MRRRLQAPAGAPHVDLRGKTVTSTVGTTSLALLQKLHTERGLDMSIVAVREDTDAFRLVETDRAAAYAMDDVLLRAEPSGSGKIVELSTDEVVRSYRAINQRELPQLVKKHTAAA